MQLSLPGNFDLPKLAYQGACALGLFYVGYKIGLSQNGCGKINVSKSFRGEADPVKSYCVQHSTPMNQVQKKLIEETLSHERSGMMGAPEVVSLNAALIRALGAKKVIDVGVFTGASSLAAALALPTEGKVIACDVSEDFTAIARKYWSEAGVASKIDLKIAPAGETLQALIEDGQENTFDFAFIDADKTGYIIYYELCHRLMRPGGIIAFDNTLWSGRVLNDPESCDEDTRALQALNAKLARDSSRSYVVQMNVGDGYTIAVKL